MFSICPFLTSSSFTYYLVHNEAFVRNIAFEKICLFAPIWSILLAIGICTTTFTCLAGGYIFGWKILIIIIPTYIFSQTLGYYLSRKIDFGLIEILKSKNKFPKFLENIKGNESKVVFFSRISPVLPFALMNLVLGILKIDFKIFTWAGLLGMFPRTLFSIWIGTQLHSFMETQQHPLSFWVIGVLIIVSFYFLMKIFTQKHQV